jgi:hypothetical protein
MIKRKRRPANMLLAALLATSLIPVACNNVNDKYANQYQQKSKTNTMKTILIIGMNPRTIDFTNPELPKGLTVEAIEQGTKATLEKLSAAGYGAELFLMEADAVNLDALGKQLKEKNYDGVVVGNGIRGIKSNFILFEQIINVVHSHAPKSKIIFNSLPTDTEEAVKRWL